MIEFDVYWNWRHRRQKLVDAECNSYLFLSGVYELEEIDRTLKSLLPEDVQIDMKLRANIMESVLITHSFKNYSLKFTERSLVQV